MSKTSLVSVFVFACFFAETGYAATFTVDRTDDAVVSACTVAAMDCTLRGAVAAANTAGGIDVIDFDGTVFATPQILALTMGELVITSTGSLSITGTGAKNLTISGSGLSRVFSNSGANTTISGLTVTGGNGTGAATTGFGGGIYNSGVLTLDAVTVTANNTAATANGGGIYNNGQITPGSLTISASTIDNNTADTGGGGILNFLGTIIVNNSTISGNTTNTAANGGGGIGNAGTITADSITVASNSAPLAAGGGVANLAGTFTTQNSIYADNTAGSNPDFSGTLVSLNHNLIEDTTGTTISLVEPRVSRKNGLLNRFKKGKTSLAAQDITGMDPMLGPLIDNGGQTQTHLIFPTSPALDAGNSALATDQRGFARPVDIVSVPNATGGNAADIGAYERPAVTAATVTLSGRVITVKGRGIFGAVVSATDEGGNVMSTRTNQFGFYRLTEVGAGQALVFTVRSRQYTFLPRIENIVGDRSDLDFVAQ